MEAQSQSRGNRGTQKETLNHYQGEKMITMQHLSPQEIYKLMATYIVPRPIAWIVTQNEEGLINIAPFSYFAPLSSTPPSVVVSIGHKEDATPKDTLANIRKSKKATICMVPQEFMERMHLSSKALDANVSEAEFFDIPTIEKIQEFAPMVEGVSVAFFCELLQEIDLQGSSTVPLVLEIKHTFVADNPQTPIARIGRSYAAIGEALKAPTLGE